MKIVVVSDSHGVNANVRYAIGQEAPFDILVHCGDIGSNIGRILGDKRDYDLIAVRGNCDNLSIYPETQFFRAQNLNVFVAHGHRYNVKYSLDSIMEEARRRRADIVLFGHSHVPEMGYTDDGIFYLNPGSVSIPHQASHKKTYAVLTIEDNIPEAVIKTLPDDIPANW